jgi:hypothetical protein
MRSKKQSDDTDGGRGKRSVLLTISSDNQSGGLVLIYLIHGELFVELRCILSALLLTCYSDKKTDDRTDMENK